MCPKTCALVKTLPRHYHHAFFSALAPGTHIVKHHGEDRLSHRRDFLASPLAVTKINAVNAVQRALETPSFLLY